MREMMPHLGKSVEQRADLRFLRRLLSAAQPQPNDPGEVKAFVPRWALCRAALKGATSSPTAGDATEISGQTVRRQKSRMPC